MAEHSLLSLYGCPMPTSNLCWLCEKAPAVVFDGRYTPVCVACHTDTPKTLPPRVERAFNAGVAEVMKVAGELLDAHRSHDRYHDRAMDEIAMSDPDIAEGR